MQCLACGAEMWLEHAARDDAIPVPGFERHTFKCVACGDAERRLRFIKHVGTSHTERVPSHTHLISRVSTAENERAAGTSVVRRVFAAVCGVCRAVGHQLVFRHNKTPRSQKVSVSTTPRTLEPPTEPVPASRLELASPNKALPTSSCSTDALSIAIAPSTSVSTVMGEKDLDECEALLRRAIEMVRGSTRSSQRETGVTDAESRPELRGSMRAEGSSTSRVVVQIHYDAHKAKYAAKDSRSGLNVLRHEDRARLRAMCDRMGWHAVETA